MYKPRYFIDGIGVDVIGLTTPLCAVCLEFTVAFYRHDNTTSEPIYAHMTKLAFQNRDNYDDLVYDY